MLLLGNRSSLVFCVVVSTVPSNKRIKRLKLSRGVDLNYFPTDAPPGNFDTCRLPRMRFHAYWQSVTENEVFMIDNKIRSGK